MRNGEQLGPRRRLLLQVVANTAIGITVGLVWLGVSVGDLVGDHLDLAAISALFGAGFIVAGCRSSSRVLRCAASSSSSAEHFARTVST
jgi:hypothetical protein